jgi:hypothetical protein
MGHQRWGILWIQRWNFGDRHQRWHFLGERINDGILGGWLFEKEAMLISCTDLLAHGCFYLPILSTQNMPFSSLQKMRQWHECALAFCLPSTRLYLSSFETLPFLSLFHIPFPFMVMGMNRFDSLFSL